VLAEHKDAIIEVIGFLHFAPGEDVMALGSVTEFVELLRKSRLLKVAQIDELVRILQPRYPDTPGLAKDLIRRGWLTVYQVNQLFQQERQQLVLGPYQITDYLGKGGVSQVFKAFHTGRNCIVALKVIHQELLAKPEAVARFQREMRIVTQLSHPNIVQAFDDVPIGVTHFYAMEFIEGTDLSKLVQLNGPLPVDQACDMIRQVALGLQHAHEKGLVHRDIKPANIVRIGDGTFVKILDMGLTRLRQGPENAADVLTLQGAMMGSPDYVSPEQARDARAVDIRADIYSLGCTFYYLLTGKPPYPGGSLMEKIHKHMNVEAAPVQSLRPDVPGGVSAIVARMMAKKADDRYRTPAEVAAALGPFCPKT
jgi:serine/threonine-protein kinase